MRASIKLFSMATVAASLVLGLAMTTAVADDPKPAEEKAKLPENFFFPNRPAEYLAMEGKPAPELALAGFINGPKFTNDDLKGNITVVDLWATWCGPCIAAIPKNNEIHDKYKDQGVVVLGVCTSRGQENLSRVMREHRMKYLVARDPQLKTEKAWNVRFYPTYAIVDRDGIVRGMGLSPARLEEAVKMILEEQPHTPDAETAAGEDEGDGEADDAGGN